MIPDHCLTRKKKIKVQWIAKHLIQLFSMNSYHYFTLILILITHCYVENCSADSDNDYGWVYPKGEVFVKVNEPLKLYCTINKENKNIKNHMGSLNGQIHQNFAFEINNEELVDSKDLIYENDTTISLILMNEKESKNQYSCKATLMVTRIPDYFDRFYSGHKMPQFEQPGRPTELEKSVFLQNLETALLANNEDKSAVHSLDYYKHILDDYKIFRQNVLIASTVVVVGSEPKKVKDITCVSNNFKELTCTWDVPNNYIDTKYTIRYMLYYDGNKTLIKCPNDDVHSNGCTWSLSTIPPYVKNYETLTVNISGVNRINKIHQLFTFNHFEHMRLKGPNNLRLVNRTCSSMTLVWDIDNFLDFTQTLTYKITYWNSACKSDRKMCSKEIILHNSQIYEVNNLAPNTEYNFQVRMKISVALEKYWSDGYMMNRIRTLSCPSFLSHNANDSPAPKNLRLQNMTCTNMLLDWDIGDLQYFPKNLIYIKITYSPISCEHTWTICDSKEIIMNNKSNSYVVTNLIPNMVYEFQVHMNVSVASKKFWWNSHTKNRTRTLSCPPFRSPKTDVGSFYVERIPNDKMRIVYIYWEPLQRFEYNGKNFSYQVTVSTNDGGNTWMQKYIVRLNSEFESYAKYKIGFFAHIFSIRSQNNEGNALNASIVQVPSEFIRIKSNPLLQKVDGNTSTLSWVSVEEKRIIDDYTIFFCRIETFQPFQCDSFIQWTHVAANTTDYLLPSNISSNYQFAISVNTLESNSGMMWIISHGFNFQAYLARALNDLTLQNITCTSMLLVWDIGDFQYFPQNGLYINISYKPISCEPAWTICDSKAIIINNNSNSYIATNLIPNVVYEFQVQLKVSVASGKYLWNRSALYQTRTLSCPPFRSPKTDIGSFYIEPVSYDRKRLVFIYWEPIQLHEYNGNNFSYQIDVSINDGGDTWNPTDIARLNSAFDSSAQYEIGYFSYSFSITSVNNEGRAQNASIVRVPSEFIRIKLNPLLHRIYYDRNTIKLSWVSVQNKRSIDNYTIFWWQIESKGLFQKDSEIHWTHVPANTTQFPLLSNISYDSQFAISVNTPESSSGMIWITSHSYKLQAPLEIDESTFNTEPTVDIGWRFPKTEPKNWMDKFFSDTCVIRVNGISNHAKKECFP